MDNLRYTLFCTIDISTSIILINSISDILANTIPPQLSWCMLEKNWLINFFHWPKPWIKLVLKLSVWPLILWFFICVLLKLGFFTLFWAIQYLHSIPGAFYKKKWLIDFCSLTQTMNKISNKIFCVTTYSMVL